ncbi:MAG: flagellar hook-basal body complex protein, partial [Candidatus Eremiobacteraeota bacterium]|nr:flagellar hook-basal body complex protein [Candidatus Eremiobacteraeota bacterium]
MSVDPLNIAAGAMDAYATANSITANNIANVDTPGYQSEAAVFQSVLGTQLSGGAGTLGGGVQIGAIDINPAQGGFIPTGSPTDLAVNGQGLFALQSPQGTVYSRVGNFTFDANGTLVDAATGFPVLGYAPNGTLSPIQVPTGSPAQATATTAASVGGNLDQNVYQAAASGLPATPVTISGTIYDSLGNAHSVQFTFTPVPPSAGGVNPATQTVNNAQGVATNVGTEWQVSVTNANPIDPMVVPPNAGYVFFSPTGQYINVSTDPTGQTNTGLGNTFSVSSWGPTDNATAPATIDVNYTAMDSLAGPSDATMTAQNGAGTGTLQS